MAATQERVLKILVIGDPAAGKTSLIKRYCHDLFSQHHKSTIGVDFSLKQISCFAPDGTPTSVRLQLWDIAGSDHAGAISRVFYKDAVGAIIVYDLARSDGVDSSRKWKEEIDHKVLLGNGSPLPVVLVGNKSDVRQVLTHEKEEMLAYAQQNGFVKWFPTSAKENSNIKEAIETLIQSILVHRDAFESTQARTDDFDLEHFVDHRENSCCW